MDLGLENAGLVALAANEHDPLCCQTIRLNRPRLPLYACDIRDLTARKLQVDLDLAEGEVDMVVGGPPCQTFSTAGKRQSLKDERGNVFLHFLDIATGLQPNYIVIENVRGLLSAPLCHRPHNQRGTGPLRPEEQPGQALAHIIQRLQDAGYRTSFNLYDTSQFGVPQVRERVILIANLTGRPVPHLALPGMPRMTVRESLSGLGPAATFIPFSTKKLRFIQMVKSGENWRSLPPELQSEAMGKAYACSGGRTGFYRRLAWDKPAPTLVTSPSMPATLLAHPDQDRPLSVEEYARLQTFPDEWRFAGRIADQYRQIGNAVPVAFAEHVGRHLLSHASGGLTSRLSAKTSRYTRTSQIDWAHAPA